jgi:2-oxo-hept-3-ene-1,7-dioate hydratase
MVQMDEFDPALAEAVYRARAEGTGGLNLSGSVPDIDSALRLQLLVLRRFVQAGDSLAGWKAAFTGAGSQGMLGEDIRPFGYLLASRIWQSGDRLAQSGPGPSEIEPELAFQLATPLDGKVSPEDVRSAVTSVAPAFELNQSRLAPNSGVTTMIADGVSHWGLVVGEQAKARPGMNRVRVKLWCNGELRSDTVPGENLEEPFTAIAKVTYLLARYGLRLEAGQRIITGSFGRQPIAGPGSWKAEFEGVGAVSVHLD